MSRGARLAATGEVGRGAPADGTIVILSSAPRGSAHGTRQAGVVPLRRPFEGDERALVAAVQRGDALATAAFVQRFCPYVQRILTRILGFDNELTDLVQDVLLSALQGIGDLRDPSALKVWLRRITVLTARTCLRRRRRRRWLQFAPDDELPEVPVDLLTPEANEALARTYGVLARMAPDHRIAFTLRFIADLDLVDVAESCGVSLATIKRRLQRAERAFLEAAAHDPVLREQVERGARWNGK